MQDLVPVQRAYEELAAGVEPGLVALGMARVARSGLPSWSTAPSSTDGTRRFLTLQIDRKATDRYAGRGFRVELERSRADAPMGGLGGRALWFQLLRDHELRPFLERQNAIIRSLPTPPDTHVDRYAESGLSLQYLSYFDEQSGFDAVRCWLRFRGIPDLLLWALELTATAPSLVERAATLLEPDARYLGRGKLV